MLPLQKAIQRLGPSWHAAGLTWLWVAFLHPTVFFHPNQALLASSRDAVKNIYTLAWQWAHGGPFQTEFAGMGWPFTEHVFYTDGHPLLAWLTGGWIVPHVVPATWTAGLLHVLIIASWGAAAALLVKILRHFGATGSFKRCGPMGIGGGWSMFRSHHPEITWVNGPVLGSRSNWIHCPTNCTSLQWDLVRMEIASEPTHTVFVPSMNST